MNEATNRVDPILLKEKILQNKLDALTKLFNETAQAYHNLAQMISNRHISKSWLDCDEETCKAARNYYAQNVL